MFPCSTPEIVGYAYSYYFGGDANGDGTTSNDLMYIPKTESDFIWATPADAQAYWDIC